MKSQELLVAALLTGLCASASVPTVSNVTTTQNGQSRRVKVNYTLSDEPGIVTLTAQTNRGDNVWVDVDDANLTHVSGDVNKVVPAGSHSFTWLPHKSWPNQLITGGNIRIGVKAWATNAPPDYMVLSLTVPNSVSFYSSAAAVPFGVTNDLYKTDCLVMRKIPAANVRWRMGSPTTEKGRTAANEAPFEVVLADDYYFGVYAVTQRQYELLMGTRPSKFNLDADYATRPVERLSYDAIRGKSKDGYDWPSNGHAVLPTCFMGRLRALTGMDGFDLPTEFQWEYACRAGCGSAFYNGTELPSASATVAPGLAAIARYKANGGFVDGSTAPDAACSAANGTAKVGSYAPNAWGIYDTLGNSWEWCLNWYQDSLASSDAETGPTTGTKRPLRGGSYSDDPKLCRAAYRHNGTADSGWYGFRLCCTATAHE